MEQLKLAYYSPMNGEFSLKELNFLFVFQVNCPGCFIHGIPVVDQLHQEFGNQVSFLGLSTAFEDFDLNTEENTRLLIDSGELIGETRKAFESQGISTYPIELNFPIAMDRFADHTFDLAQAVEDICNTNPNFSTWPTFDQDTLRKKIMAYLKEQVCIPVTFTLNQMRGTPTFIVFNEKMDILRHHFGHQSVHSLRSELNELLSVSN
ncbi:hypothetical protein [Ekhidna sp.]|uniref:hypothetical protein n=1 Tax=Ekhidna sp. TaxID=2608089 RepID=UPI003C7C034F